MSRKMAPIKKRLLEFLNDNSIAHSEFASNTGICESILRKKNNELSLDSIVRISTVYKNISLDWLINGTGSRLKTDCSGYASVKTDDIIRLHKELIEELRDGKLSDKKLIETQEKYITVLEKTIKSRKA